MADFLPYGRQCLDEDDIAAVVATLKSDFLTCGPVTEAFEAALAERTKAPFAVVCGNCTAALHLALLALNPDEHAERWPEGSAAIVPSITFLATANTARWAGLEVEFCDVDPETALMRPQDLDQAVARAKARGLIPKVVLPVHFAGQPPDLAALADRAKAHNLVVVEDAAHAVGSAYKSAPEEDWTPVGACRHSAMTCFSFHPVKTVAMGEGGAITTQDPKLARRLTSLRSHGIERDPTKMRSPERAFTDGLANPWYYEMAEIGLNYRATEMQCALGLSQMKKLDSFAERRRSLSARYRQLLLPYAPQLKPLCGRPNVLVAWHLFSVLIDFKACGVSRAEVMTELRKRGIGTQVHYIPVHSQPYYRARSSAPVSLPGAEAYYARTLSLPLFPAMHDEDVHRVVSALLDVLGLRR